MLILNIMRRLKLHQTFLQDVLNQANRHQREALLQAANSDQINALSELSLNLLKKHIPVSAGTVDKLKRHKNQLRELSKRRHSVKKRRQLLSNQKGGNFWKGLHEAYKACYK